MQSFFEKPQALPHWLDGQGLPLVFGKSSDGSFDVTSLQDPKLIWIMRNNFKGRSTPQWRRRIIFFCTWLATPLRFRRLASAYIILPTSGIRFQKIITFII